MDGTRERRARKLLGPEVGALSEVVGLLRVDDGLAGEGDDLGRAGSVGCGVSSLLSAVSMAIRVFGQKAACSPQGYASAPYAWGCFSPLPGVDAGAASGALLATRKRVLRKAPKELGKSRSAQPRKCNPIDRRCARLSQTHCGFPLSQRHHPHCR